MPVKHLTSDDYSRAAQILDVPVAAIRAVTDVESKDSGYLPDGRPVILFERHIMLRQLIKNGHVADAQRFSVAQPDIVNEKTGGYKGGTAEWDRISRAIAIHRQSALESASWGRFQVMGFNWKSLGYNSVQDFVNAMYRSEGDQLDAFVRFIKSKPRLQRALKSQKWADFAAGYNGPAYLKNDYHTKLAAAFAHHSKEIS